MKKFFLILLLLPTVVFAQKTKIPAKQTSSAVNKNGWRDLNWGASPSSVKSKYNTSEYDPKNKWCILENYEIASKKYRVIFHFDTNNQLESVVLARFHFYSKETKFRFEVEKEISELQNEIENGITAKFGNPTFKSNSPNYLRAWNFPNLKIEISSSITYKPKMAKNGITLDETQSENDLVMNDNFNLEYSKPNKTETDKF